MRLAYALLCILGFALPLMQIFPWLTQHGAALTLLMQQAFGSPVASFAWADVLLSGVTLVIFVFAEGRRLAMPHLWLPVAGLLLVGVSLGLPLFLLLREQHLRGKRAAETPLPSSPVRSSFR